MYSLHNIDINSVNIHTWIGNSQTFNDKPCIKYKNQNIFQVTKLLPNWNLNMIVQIPKLSILSIFLIVRGLFPWDVEIKSNLNLFYGIINGLMVWLLKIWGLNGFYFCKSESILVFHIPLSLWDRFSMLNMNVAMG